MHEMKFELNRDPKVMDAAAALQLRLTQLVNALQDFYGEAALAEESEWAIQEGTLAQGMHNIAVAMLATGMEFIDAVRAATRGRSSDEMRLILFSFQQPQLPSSEFFLRMQGSTEKEARTRIPPQSDI